MKLYCPAHALLCDNCGQSGRRVVERASDGARWCIECIDLWAEGNDQTVPLTGEP